MRHALVRHQHVVDDIGQALEVAQHRLQEIIGVSGQRIGLLDIVDAVDQRAKPLGIIGRVGRKRDVNEGDDASRPRGCLDRLLRKTVQLPGFGEGNFKALFESIEEDQIRRGVLKVENAA